VAEHLPEEVRGYYEEDREHERLAIAAGPLELARTQEIILRHLPPGGLRVLDVGGGSGVYAAWLAGLGHHVHLVDPVPLHVERAQAAAVAAEHSFTAAVGDSRSLDHEDTSFDAVLLLGPLYHLTAQADRVTALAEARRVLRPGGLVFAAAISRFASLLDGLAREFLLDAEFREVVRNDLVDGQHRNEQRRRGWFTTAFFHHPDELASEASDAGLTVRELVGVEGPAAYLAPLLDRWNDPAVREIALFAAAAVEREPTLLGLGPHLLVVAERPNAGH